MQALKETAIPRWTAPRGRAEAWFFALLALVLAIVPTARAQDDAGPGEPQASPAPAPAEEAAAPPDPPAPRPTAAEPQAPEDAPPPPEVATEKKPKPSMVEKRAIATTEVGTFGLKGRVFANLELRRRNDQLVVDRDGVARSTDVDSLDLVLDSARFSLLYQIPDRWLSMEIEIEVSDPDQVELRDAYLLAAHDALSFKVGNFKIPTSAIELESAWKLPSSRRGFINDLLLDALDVANRRPGMQLAYRGRGGLKPTVILGAFQGTELVEHVGDDRDTELLDEAGLDAQSWAARAQIELGKLDIGVFYEHRVGSARPFETQHYPVAGADFVFAQELGSYGLRAWLDVHYGESWYAHAEKRASEGAPWFLALRMILAARYGGTSDGTFYLEPFGSLGLLDPDLDVTSDWAHEVAVGINVGFWDRARISLEGFVNRTARNFPTSYFGGPFAERLGLTLRFEAAF